jgi:hypothetical protein
MALQRGGAAAVAAALVDLGRNGEKEAVGAREGSARRLGLRTRPFRFQRASESGRISARDSAGCHAPNFFYRARYFAASAGARF